MIGGVPETTIDVHAHVAIPAVDVLVADEPGYREQRRVDAAALGQASIALSRTLLGELGPRLTEVELRLEAMDRAQVDLQAVSPLPSPHAWAPRGLADRIVETTNEAVAAHCAKAPHRLVGIGTVALQHPDLAAGQLVRAVSDLGLRGVQVSTSAGSGRELDDRSLEEFWAAAEELDVAVFIHPWGCSLGSRLGDYYLFNTVGNPVETALALSRLLFSGLLERRPRLKIWSAHGGGYLPSYIARSDHAWRAREDAHTTREPPSVLLRRTFVDSLVYSPDQLHHLVGVMGAGQVTLGSDYPFDMGVEDPVDRVLAAGLAPAEVLAIFGRNARRLLSLDTATTTRGT